MTLLTLVHKIDIALLLGTRSAVEFCVEWFSWSQRWMERTLIGGYVFSATAGGVADGFSPWWYLLTGMVMFDFIRLHVRPDRDRIARLWSGQDAAVRVVSISFLLPALVFDLLPPSRLLNALFVAKDICFVATMLMTALPTSGTPGRRRRAAHAKLADLFSPSLEPAMEGAA